MKTLKNIAAALLIITSVNAFASEKTPAKSKTSLNKSIAVAPFSFGNPDEAAPENLKALTVKVAPMIYGDASETAPEELVNLKRVPVAPMIYGNADEEAPENLRALTVKVAPMVYGDSSEAAPVIE
ncbi:hypothetical protein GS399_02210 [Pedobacter sp. HMF7647]|uniref:TonB-dependent receptor n=1 Tax=Hufsiella arboris TaxID=2695275 RepID=A0A7K1Y6U8_9SPHI|nr:hypothetical protein [Hufsiella arboris]MXV49768.1 hypothetical protein [Hufsiella arboris]